MEALLRDPTLRGKRVFESRNGGYVMFMAAVDFVPDIMMKLARKEIMDGHGRCHGSDNTGMSLNFVGKSLAPPLSCRRSLRFLRSDHSRHAFCAAFRILDRPEPCV